MNFAIHKMLIPTIRWVVTDLGNAIATSIGMDKAAITEEESAAGVFEQVSSLQQVFVTKSYSQVFID
jgi:hypothetical protein